MASKKLNVADKVAKVGSKIQKFESADSNFNSKQKEKVYLNLSQLHPNPENREIYSTFDVDQMAETIKEKGIIASLQVCVWPEKGENAYKILDGETRYLAAKKINYEPIPCDINVVKSKADEHLVSLYANLQREKKQTERARELEKLLAALEQKEMEEPGYLGGLSPVDKAAKILGLSPTVIRRDRRVLKLIPELQAMVDSGDITSNAAENFAGMSEEAQREIVKLAEAKNAEGQKLSRDEAIKIKNDYKAELNRLKVEKSQAEIEIKKLAKDAEQAKGTVATLQKQLESERQIREKKIAEDTKKAMEALEKKGASPSGKNPMEDVEKKLLQDQATAANSKIEELEKKLSEERDRAAKLEEEKAKKEAEIAAMKDDPGITDADKVQARVLIDTAFNQLALVEDNMKKLYSIAGAMDNEDFKKLKAQIQALLKTVGK